MLRVDMSRTLIGFGLNLDFGYEMLFSDFGKEYCEIQMAFQ